MCWGRHPSSLCQVTSGSTPSRISILIRDWQCGLSHRWLFAIEVVRKVTLNLCSILNWNVIVVTTPIKKHYGFYRTSTILKIWLGDLIIIIIRDDLIRRLPTFFETRTHIFSKLYHMKKYFKFHVEKKSIK